MEVSWNGEMHSHFQPSVGAQESVLSPPIDARTRACIETCVNDGLKPTQILRKSRCEGFMVTTTVQLANCVAYIRREQQVQNSLLG